MKVGYQILADLQQQQAFKQWGFEETETKTIAFPISFESIKYVFLSKIYGPASGGADTVAYNFFRKSLTGVSFDYAYTRNWLAIGGKQPQWGYYVESQNPTDYRYWSIPFTSHYITMATKTYYEPKEEAVPWLVGIDMQKFICGYGANFIGSSYVSCVGIGCQPQWGFTNNTGRPYITFPFKFSNVFTAISCICHNGSPSEANTVYNVSISGMNIGASGGGSGKYWCAFGVAQQQWGANIHGWVTFPITFVKFRRLVTNHQGNVFMDSKARESNTLSGFTLDVADNSDQNKDAQWIAIGA